jgi:hypothetical protein
MLELDSRPTAFARTAARRWERSVADAEGSVPTDVDCKAGAERYAGKPEREPPKHKKKRAKKRIAKRI